MERRMLCVFCFVASVVRIHGFNVDTEFPVVFTGPENSSFGFAVQLLVNRRESLALVTAPTAEFLGSPKGHKIGALYKCSLSADCQQVILDNPNDGSGKTPYRETYRETKINMSLGVSLDIQLSGYGAVVVCGHLWKNTFDQQKIYFANGACYVINNNLNNSTVKKLLPLTNESKQYRGYPTVNHYYSLGMAGFSAAFTEDGKRLLLGAPGVAELIGSVVDYGMEPNMAQQKPYVADPLEVKESLTENSLIGYSVSSGMFSKTGELSYIAGAPRAENDIGCVYIFEQFPYPSSRGGDPIIQEKIVGEKMGEYFGSVVLGVNVNNDRYTDIVVGAPFYSTSTAYDKGRVYVYISDGVTFRKQYEKLEGSGKPYARFGTAIAAAGDLNQDGFIDLAIGAPYEDDGIGAVYIYHSTTDGVKANYAQRIVPEELKVDLAGFGFSISKGIDIDSNSYPDLLIGAYSSDHAVLLRSHPLVSVHGKMEFNMKQIRVNSSNCEIDGTREDCFEMEYCLKYSGEFVPDSVGMKVFLEADVHTLSAPRVYFVDEATMERKPQIEIDVTLLKDALICNMRKVYVKKNVEDFISPMPFIMTYDVKKRSSQHFCSTCPILDKRIPNRLIDEIMFWTGCGDDNECLSDVKVEVSLVGFRDKEIVIGEKKPLILEVTTKNEGEPAYQSVVHVCMPRDIEIINVAECQLNYDDTTNTCLSCNVGNPLKSEQSESFQLKLDTTKLSRNLTELEIEFMIDTASSDTDLSNNNVTVRIPFVSKAGVRLIGSTDSKIIYLKEEMPEKIPITHKYTIAKFMPSPVSSINVTLSIPVKLATDRWAFLNVSDIHAEERKASRITARCDIGEENMQHNKNSHPKNVHGQNFLGNRYIPSGHPDHSDYDTMFIDCSTAVCHTAHCIVGPFPHQEAVTFQIVGFINLTVLQKIMGKSDVTVLLSEAYAEISDENIKLTSPRHSASDFAVVTTSLEKHDLHKTQKIAWWIIIVSVIAGLILLTLVILICVKTGFFRRKKLEEMAKLAETDCLLNKEKPEAADNEGTLINHR